MAIMEIIQFGSRVSPLVFYLVTCFIGRGGRVGQDEIT